MGSNKETTSNNRNQTTQALIVRKNKRCNFKEIIMYINHIFKMHHTSYEKNYMFIYIIDRYIYYLQNVNQLIRFKLTRDFFKRIIDVIIHFRFPPLAAT